ncbi:transcriptional regulator, XRE family [Xylanimonas cellulosilytica DSM 15894]|uniref:Transcriptional regulator, XRE family n=1 Tax=Xylanimonas cellulosilytica (strain DSM 15894 / JCM 12276 / CECT 5975 / KCTC 9989 / LMG 20990 / NBRC 107835 / XIL07) TaxID=446471 RepID=D1BUT7_XYLCX|nr:helix-turn-helix transcriptional regulator [Xylanimonas cellulosilytica]ACZ29328.1 transcriptional regulator, XRE family [Xylanimonas cellulosilytica DSM 15894]
MPADIPTDSLGAFLRASRARITPEDAGIPRYGERRRVVGLRREELALLAGVSASYYTRLEQGQSRNASPEVLDALASALQLDDAERAHLGRLAGGRGHRQPARRPTPETVAPALAGLLDSLAAVPALVMGRRSDVLAWNPLGHALLAGHLRPDAPEAAATRPNMATLVFTDVDTRELYADWRAKSRAVVGNLRLTAGQHPDDPELASLVGRLTMTSTEFASLWADHQVQACATADYALHHPLVGDLTVTQQTLRSIDRPDQTLVTHTTPAGSPSAEAITLLAQLVGDRPSHHTAPPRTAQQHPDSPGVVPSRLLNGRG